jgi:hypothetical protein
MVSVDIIFVEIFPEGFDKNPLHIATELCRGIAKWF